MLGFTRKTFKLARSRMNSNESEIHKNPKFVSDLPQSSDLDRNLIQTNTSEFEFELRND